jgi:aspartate kinase
MTAKRPLIVQKYGGSSLAQASQIQDVAARVAQLHKEGHSLIIVVSAMGKTTDQLVELAYKVSPTPNRRELDMLLTTGERVSMALMSMALNDRTCPSISFTGSQAGVFTDDGHSNARIIDVKPVRVQAELDRHHVVVLAGFQGVSPRTKEITTLGRGGSDTTAVAMAAYFKAERCEIRKDVDGVHSADPNTVRGTSHIAHLHYNSLLDMTFWGAKVLHYRSVELAALLKIPMLIALAHQDKIIKEERSTLIDGEAKMYESARILSVNTHKEICLLHVKGADFALAFAAIGAALKPLDLPMPQFLDSECRDGRCSFLITAPQETLNAITQIAAKSSVLEVEAKELSSVTATCQGAYASALPGEIVAALSRHSVQTHKMIFGAMSLTVIVSAKDRNKAVQTIHDLHLSGDSSTIGSSATN